ncbi:protein phosphatase 1 regulatory subunit 16A [Procambarus clarkii]|uniref:protein phosphatase 1 regulatory subunit 16A n=1 Tax=Procambarus clarkii TaxID=6728 RepID=UPI001E674566|nr:protein phosphatase 1 regulatory subunit 16A-like [Procambarus clarkii]XP_045615273.1 protein phosphatase 1 regulatory subunit 16A-like [Procambarus clarkii]XP_045615274.1 protein phosphatase 1 regulatory subunit 16A-like [Procambarus clarkii]XP_045615275.1 protein phosphatase 1 regulatory subunit 16A-like [Procambarus clarkii]
MEHSELIAEMAYIEKLSTQERLKLARRRRMQQMKKWSQKEREITGSKREKTAQNEAQKRRRENRKSVMFISNVMLLEAAARNDIEEVQALLEAGVNPDSTNEDGLTALHQCCIDDSEEMMRLLVHHGADVNAQDSEKWTPLHAAATCGHLHLAKFLIAKSANLLAVNADGNMPYDICEDDATLDYIESEMARRGVTQRLIDETRSATETQMLTDLKCMKSEGQSLMFRDHQGATPLHVAAANGYVRVVEYLLSQNVPTEVRDHDDWSPLHAAACWGHPDVLELLVQNGANLHARTKNQETPYDICEDAELRERIMQLISEQETKRLHDQTKRVRRTHSNTRTQSVRRTSIREKTLTPKKEAQEEARIRLQLEHKKKPLQEDSPSLGGLRAVKEGGEGSPLTSFPAVIPANISNNNSPKDNLLVEEEEEELKKEERENEKKEDAGKTNTIPEEEENQVSLLPATVAKTEELLVRSGSDSSSLVCNNGFKIKTSSPTKDRLEGHQSSPPIPPPRSSSTTRQDIIETNANGANGIGGGGMVTHSGEGGSKIDIHVTVTVNPFSPGTLADLKKQRAMSRASQSSYTLASAGSTYSLTAPEYDPRTHGRNPEFTASSVRVDTVSYRPPASPSLTPRKFCGDPTEVIGGVDAQSCCSMM